jgi:hypothetical protein
MKGLDSLLHEINDYKVTLFEFTLKFHYFNFFFINRLSILKYQQKRLVAIVLLAVLKLFQINLNK